MGPGLPARHLPVPHPEGRRVVVVPLVLVSLIVFQTSHQLSYIVMYVCYNLAVLLEYHNHIYMSSHIGCRSDICYFQIISFHCVGNFCTVVNVWAGCVDELGSSWEDGDSWTPSRDPCQQCVCRGGQIDCHRQQCQVRTRNKIYFYSKTEVNGPIFVFPTSS